MGLARARRLLAECRVALLDMNGTFMFGEDRFGPDEDYHASYRGAGGRALSLIAVRTAVTACVEHMGRLYVDPAHVDDFPPVREVLASLSEPLGLPAEEQEYLARVLALHELGRVPDVYAAALCRLAGTHRLGLAANVWAPKDLWLAELTRAGLGQVFAVQVFSSDSRSMKPSPRLYAEALRRVGIEGPGPHPDVVFIGDSLRCDIAGALEAGLRTIWLDLAGGGPPPAGPIPDATVPDLQTLLE